MDYSNWVQIQHAGQFDYPTSFNKFVSEIAGLLNELDIPVKQVPLNSSPVTIYIGKERTEVVPLLVTSAWIFGVSCGGLITLLNPEKISIENMTYLVLRLS